MRPKLVVEVRYDHVTDDRFRHGTKLVRFRPDKAPRQCTFEQIAPAAQPSGFQGLPGPRGTADDLKKLTGVSGTIEKKLNDLGVFHYWQLAELDHDTAHYIAEEVGLPARADAWVTQAKALTAEAE